MEKFEGMSFEEAMKLLEEKIAILEAEDDNDESDTIAVYEDAVLLKDYCAQLLAKEREEIKRIAKENNIPLSEIGLEESDLSIDDSGNLDDLTNK